MMEGDMKNPYFVILKHPNAEYIVPMTDEQGDICQFSSKKEAREGAESSFLGSEVGYEVFNFQDN